MSKWRKEARSWHSSVCFDAIYLGLSYNISFSRIQKLEALLFRPQGQSRELPRVSIAETRFEAQFYACLICLITESLEPHFKHVYNQALRVPPFQNHMDTTNFYLPCSKHMLRKRLDHFLVYSCPGIISHFQINYL